MQGSRPARIGEEIRQELADLLSREVRDPGIGFITVTHVKVSADLQVARAYYTTLGDEAARRTTAKALERAKPFLRQRIAAHVGLRRAPELAFQYDESIAREERIETLLAEETRMGMLVGVAVGWQLAGEVGNPNDTEGD